MIHQSHGEWELDRRRDNQINIELHLTSQEKMDTLLRSIAELGHVNVRRVQLPETKFVGIGSNVMALSAPFFFFLKFDQCMWSTVVHE